MFHVISGKVKVRVWMDEKLVDETVIKAGESTAVPYKMEHQFEGLEKSVCLEIYYTFLEPGDINRRAGSQGCVNK